MKSPITRRKFIKLSGFATLSVGSGFAVGKIMGGYQKSQFSICGFLPSDDKLISQIINAFYKTVRCYSEPIIIADNYYRDILTRVNNELRRDLFEKNGTVTYSIKKINKEVKSDIIVSDDHNTVYSTNTDMDTEMRNIRTELRGLKADVFFSIVYNQPGMFSSLINPGGVNIVIRNDNGIFDKIPIKTSYKNIIVNGPQGKTEIAVKNGLINIVKSTCRHKLCEKAGYVANAGDIIACAPNKVLIKIEEA